MSLKKQLIQQRLACEDIQKARQVVKERQSRVNEQVKEWKLRKMAEKPTFPGKQVTGYPRVSD